MKKIFSIIVTAIILLSGFISIAKSGDADRVEILEESFYISTPIINDIGDFLIVDFEEYDGFLKEPSKPLLPIIKRVFTFPLGTQILDVKMNYDTNQYELTKRISPCQTQILSDGNKKITADIIEIDEITYTSNSYYPESTYFIHKGAGLLNNEHVLYLTINVVPQYNPYENVILIPDVVNIKINNLPPEEPFFKADEFEMVIISPEKFADSLQPLVDHKNNVGVRTFLKTTEEIYQEYFGRDKAEKIKYFIKDSVENLGIDYILIFGDVDLVPMRKTSIEFFVLSGKGILTDLYYEDIYDANFSFSSWDSNNNSLFGEYEWTNLSLAEQYIDDIDLYPDVKVGRLPCSNEKELQIMVEKIITYETETYGQDWFNRLILMGGNCDLSYSEIYEGEWKTKMTGNEMGKHGFNPIYLWTSLGNFLPSTINKEINPGAGFVVYAGHGDERGIGTYTPDNEKIRYTKPYLNGLNNKNCYPIFYLDACSTGQLEFSMLYFFRSFPVLYRILKGLDLFSNTKLPCLAWSIIKKQLGGGIASIAATNIGYDILNGQLTGDYNDYIKGTALLHKTFFENYESGIILSDMFCNAKIDYLNNYGLDPVTIEAYTLFGDPSLKIGGYNED